MKTILLVLFSLVSGSTFATASSNFTCANKNNGTTLTITVSGDRAQVILKSPIKKSLECTLFGSYFNDELNKVVFGNFGCWESNNFANDEISGNVILAVNSQFLGKIIFRDFEDRELECFLSKP